MSSDTTRPRPIASATKARSSAEVIAEAVLIILALLGLFCGICGLVGIPLWWGVLLVSLGYLMTIADSETKKDSKP